MPGWRSGFAPPLGGCRRKKSTTGWRRETLSSASTSPTVAVSTTFPESRGTEMEAIILLVGLYVTGLGIEYCYKPRRRYHR